MCMYWFAGYKYSNIFVILLILVGVGGGTFLICKMTVTFYSGRTKIQEKEDKDEQSMSTLDLFGNKNYDQLAASHSDFIDFALNKKADYNCKICSRELSNLGVKSRIIDQVCSDCKNKQQR